MIQLEELRGEKLRERSLGVLILFTGKCGFCVMSLMHHNVVCGEVSERQVFGWCVDDQCLYEICIDSSFVTVHADTDEINFNRTFLPRVHTSYTVPLSQ